MNKYKFAGNNTGNKLLGYMRNLLDTKENVLEETDELYAKVKWQAVNDNYESELNLGTNTPGDTRRVMNLKKYIGTEKNVVVKPYNYIDPNIVKTYINPMTTQVNPTRTGLFSRTSLGESYYTTPETITFEDGVEISHSGAPIGMFNNCRELREIHGLEKIDLGWALAFYSMFFNCTNLEYADLSGLANARANMTGYMFAACALPEIQLPTTFNTSNCKNFTFMFANTIVESLDLTMLDIKNATRLDNMFNNAKKLQEIKVSRDKWVIQEGCNTTDMFKNCGVDHVTYVD